MTKNQKRKWYNIFKTKKENDRNMLCVVVFGL
jgi:hypothetical protein